MQRFYTTNISGDIAELPEEEARHCIKVLRKQVGDLVELVDGLGSIWEGRLLTDDIRHCQIRLHKELPNTQKRNFQLTVAIAPPKNNERFEWFLEKATEIGIDTIVPIYTARSERRKLNLDRLNKVLVAAMKQSGKAELPILKDSVSLGDLWQLYQEATVEKYIAVCFGDELPHLKDAYGKGKNALILIGPEGDFTEAEAQTAIRHNFQPISLGRSRLRLETAGIVACHIVNLLNE
ncbi:MAG: 16S rRNA (uracil(1498)-N(3))-methyltransferase [Chitinophagales bacterium]|nr:16S rRNA (uracil(1498)-N(3))-methyltransferase [Chitinophagales bacterium]